MEIDTLSVTRSRNILDTDLSDDSSDRLKCEALAIRWITPAFFPWKLYGEIFKDFITMPEGNLEWTKRKSSIFA